MRKYTEALIMAVLCLFGFTATAFAEGAIAPQDQSLNDMAKAVYDAIVHGQYWIAAFSVVILLVAALRKYVPEDWKLGIAMRSKFGGMITAFVLAYAGAAITGLLALGPTGAMSGALALTAGKIGMAAVGGYTVLNTLAQAVVATAWYQAHAPAWLKAIVAFVMAAIGSSAVDKAKAAGDAAVIANPPTGAAGSSTFTKF